MDIVALRAEQVATTGKVIRHDDFAFSQPGLIAGADAGFEQRCEVSSRSYCPAALSGAGARRVSSGAGHYHVTVYSRLSVVSRIPGAVGGME